MGSLGEDNSIGGAQSSTELSEEEDGGEDGSGSHLQSLVMRETIRVKYDDSVKQVAISGGNHQVNRDRVIELCKIFGGKLMSSDEVKGRGGNTSWQFTCSNDHEFIITTCKLSQLREISISNQTCQ